ncbi:MAG: hypothetical protein QNI84_02475 [Henriciella sp.]|nr:hypothetical protein [Henriciella sp.]
MKWFELAFDVFLAVIFYGVLATVGGFLALFFFSDFDFEMVFRLTIGIGVVSALLGAIVPTLRNFAVSVFSFLSPLGW